MEVVVVVMVVQIVQCREREATVRTSIRTKDGRPNSVDGRPNSVDGRPNSVDGNWSENESNIDMCIHACKQTHGVVKEPRDLNAKPTDHVQHKAPPSSSASFQHAVDTPEKRPSIRV